MLNAESYLALNGYCDLLADPGADPDTWGDHYTVLDISAGLSILENWNNPPTSPDWQQGQYVDALYLDADGGGIFGVGNYQSSGVYGAYDAVYKMLMVPPKGSSNGINS